MTNPVAKKINKTSFFDSVRASLFNNSLGEKQVSGMEAVINEFELRALTDIRWLAYMLATAFHESGQTMQAIEEYGKGKGYDYGKKLKRTRKPYSTPDKLYYGRGLVQLTWYENYESMGKFLSIDLLNHPELALDIKVAVKIMFEGMIRGLFTGVSLPHYFNGNAEDWTNARKIINGLDCSAKIEGHAKKFLSALRLV